MLLIKRKIVISILFILIVNSLVAQNKQINNWIFGYRSAINFNTSPPTVLSNSSIDQLEGSSSISDVNGNLLFYTDGITIWNKQHIRMPNGNGLLGDESSSQSALIIPKPGSTSIFYVFTAPAWGDKSNTGIRYSVVDLDLNNGLGDVVTNQKNISLLAPATEKLAAIFHTNGKDVWVVSSKYYTDQYYAYLITEEGVCTVPVVSRIGQHQTQFQGYLKFSPDGTKLVSAQASGYVELFNFDACTGLLSNLVRLPLIQTYYVSFFYGASFSPDNSKLYLSTGWAAMEGCPRVYQYDMNAPDIGKSQTLIFKTVHDQGEHLGCLGDAIGAIQIGPDSKIYIVSWKYDYLHVINNPNEPASKVDFVRDGLYIGKASGRLGLPNFIESYFNKSVSTKTCSPNTLIADFSYNKTCLLDATQFINLSNANPESSLSYQWFFGDPASGVDNSSNETSPTHIFSATGTYQVTLRVTSGIDCNSSTISKTVTILSLSQAQANLGLDQTLCLGEAIILESSPKGERFHWQDESTESNITVTKSGTYWVDVTIGACTTRDSIQITVQECLENLKIPNVFTPNGDDSNETFTIEGAKGVTWNLDVFNRWGIQVAKYENYQNDWEAHGLENAIYYYILKSQYSGKSFKGWVQVLR